MRFINTLLFVGLIAIFQAKSLKQEEQSFLANNEEADKLTTDVAVAQPETEQENEVAVEAQPEAANTNTEEATD